MVLNAALPAQRPALWHPSESNVLPTPGGAGQLEMVLRPPATGVDSLAVEARVRLTGGTVYLYVYGRNARNEYLGYRESGRITTARDTTITLRVRGLATADMDTVIVGLYHYGTGTATAAPPAVTRRTVPAAAPEGRVAAYLDEFFGLVREQALDRELLDWASLRADADALAAGADSLAAVHDVLDFTLRRIDRHSSLQRPLAHQGWASGNNDSDAVDPNLEYPTGRRVDERMVYLVVPGVSSGHNKTLLAYADSLNRLIERLDQAGTDEWVLDLRGNTGGNCWAMLAGVGPLLGEGRCGYFMQRDGSGATGWWYWEGGSWLGRRKQLTLTAPYTLRDSARIAVLYGPKTSSSGEVVAVAFRGMANTRSFGQPTGGYSTGNRILRLSDGAAVLLTTTVYGDRNKVPFGDTLEPDEIVPLQKGTDAPAEAAAAWLRSGR